MPYMFSNRFYLRQAVLLLVSGGALLFLSRYQEWDLMLSDFWFDQQTMSFPLIDNYWLAVVNHHYIKYAVIAVALMTFVLGALLRKFHWMIVALIMVAGPGVVSLLKSFSHHSCPWDLVRYGGSDYEYPLLGSAEGFVGKGGCFPGGHASGGFGLLALYFLLYPWSKNAATWGVMLVILLGMVMGFGQVMRGAHFFSHNLWSVWWVWLTQVFLYFVYSSLYYFRRRPVRQEAEV